VAATVAEDAPKGHETRTEAAARAALATLPAAMSKVCAVCGKKPSFGNSRSHSMVATKRRFEPNLQRVRVLLAGKAQRAYVCTRCLKGGKVQKAL
jgi:large subunit ribosomal protein L28